MKPDPYAMLMSSLRVERVDLDVAPFDGQGGLGGIFQLFEAEGDGLIEKVNREWVP